MIALYAIVAAFVVGAGMGGYGGWDWATSRQAHKDALLVEAQQKVDALVVEQKVAAAAKVTDMQAAYKAGEANAKVVTKTVYAKGQAYVQNTPAIRNPACTVGPDGMLLLAAARAGTLSAADTARIDAALSRSGAGGGRADGDAVPANDPGRGAVPSVQPQASGARSPDQVSGTGAGRVYKNPLAK